MKVQLKSKDFELLDSIRGIASLYVAIAHCRGSLWMGGNAYLQMFPRDTWNIWDYLIVGSSMTTRLAVEFVIVFFVLSGFSIAHSLSSNKSPLQFYFRRLIRIYPSYLLALVWVGFVFWITRYWHPEWYDGSLTNYSFVRTIEMPGYFDKTVILNNLLYMPGKGFIAPFWSLTYEIMFYLLAPFILRKVSIYAIVSLLLFLSYQVAPSFIQSLRLPFYLFEFLFIYNIYFVIGVSLYNYYPFIEKIFNKISKGLHLLVIAGFLLITYAISIYFAIETVLSFISSAFMSVFLIVFFIKYKVRIRWLMNVGKYSYTLYITHFASVFLYLGFYWLLVKPDAPYIVNYLIWIPAVFFCLLVAWLQYLLVEKNTKNILNKLRKKSGLQKHGKESFVPVPNPQPKA